jgi:hypothetical protein
MAEERTTQPPADQAPEPPADQAGVAPAADEKLWPKPARDAYLKAAQEAAQYRKQAEELQRRISEMERDLRASEQLLAGYLQQYGQQGQDYQAMPQPPQRPAQPTTEEPELDPYDPDSLKGYLRKTMEDWRKQLWEQYLQDQQYRQQVANFNTALSIYWARQLYHLLGQDRDLKDEDIYRLMQHAAQSRHYDLLKAYQEVYRDKLLEAERQRIREEERKRLASEQAPPAAPPVIGGAPTPRRLATPRPSSWEEALYQAVQEGRGKIAVPE